jgi:Cu/Ag efflux protein CusF
MMRKITLFALLLLFACLGYAVAQSQSHPPKERQFPPQQPLVNEETPDQEQMGPQKLTGEIQNINLEKKTISIRDEISHTVQDVDFNDSTTFSKDAKAMTIGDLKKGDKVSLEVDSQNIVTKVEIVIPESVPPPQQKQ